MPQINFLNTVDFHGNETKNQVIHNLAANPSAANSELGQVYFNTASSELRVCTNASTPTWVAVGSTYTLSAGASNGTDQPLPSGSLLDITASDAYLLTTVSAAGSTITVDVTHANSGVTANTYAYPTSVTVNAAGHVTAISAGSAPGTMSSFGVDGDTGPVQTISNGDTLLILGDTTYINTVASATDTITINHATITQNNTSSSPSPGYGGTFNVIDSVSRNGAGHVTGVNVATVTMPATPSWTISDGSTTQPIANGDTLTVTTNTGLDGVVSATDQLTLSLDLSELTTVTTIDPAADFLVGVDGTANEKILYQNVHLNQWGAAEGNISMGNNKITNLADGTASTDAANLGQVQSLIAGVGLFQGGYNANTGLTTDLGTNGSLDGASNIALDKGDFFVVTTAGTAFYSETLEVGDMIYANQDITANSNPAQSVYTVVIQDENIAGSGATDGATQKGVAGFDSANFDVSATGWVQIKAGGVILGTETTGTYVTSVEADTDNNRLGIEVDTGGAGDAKTETVGLNIVDRTDIAANTADADSLLIYDASVTTNKKVTAGNLATYVKSKIEKRDAYLVLNDATSGITSTNNGTDTISWTLTLLTLDTNGVIDIGSDKQAVKVEVINLDDTTDFDAYATLYPTVVRAATSGDITIEFQKKTWATAGLPSQADYAVLLSYVGAY